MARTLDRRIGQASARRKDALSETDYETLAEFRYALRRFLNRSAAAARSASLTPQQHQALLAIRGHAGGAISIGGLAEKLTVKHHSAGELVERLLQAGLVERRTDHADRRRTFVSLSTRARSLLATLSTNHLEELRLIQPSLQRLLAKLEAS
jgi:DNA-binding MarR family transcriptional regulator